MTGKNIAIPTVHMNGTSYENLLEQVLKAYRSLQDTEKALREMTPNGRDYYVQGGSAGEEARRQHQRRMAAIRDIQKELEEIAIGIQDQERR